MFWFLLACDLLIPLVMLGAGWWMRRRPPKEINGVLGYRTARSMKNEDTWRFAHEHCGRTWQAWGLAMLLLSAAAHIPFFRATEDALGVMSLMLMGVQCAALLASIVPTERALRRTFDENGQRREA